MPERATPRITLASLLDPERPSGADIEWDIKWLRDRLADHPPTTYRHYPPSPAALEAGER
jgi:hypothetical protein